MKIKLYLLPKDTRCFVCDNSAPSMSTRRRAFAPSPALRQFPVFHKFRTAPLLNHPLGQLGNRTL